MKCDTLPLCRDFRRRDFIPSHTMKKTLLLLTLAASLGLAYAAESNSSTEEEKVTLTFSNTTKEPDNNTDGGACHGIAFTLSSHPSRLTISCEDLTEIPSFSTFDLESISIKVRSGEDWVDTAAYIIDDTTNTVLAHSTNTTGELSGGAMASFQFNSLTLNAGTGYKLFFVNASQINDSYIAVGNVMEANYQLKRQMAAFAAGESTNVAECGFTTGINATASADYAPVVSIQGQVLIPEPTTATLSLLALAGLAARRRRR